MKQLIALLFLLTTSCSTLPTNPDWWMEQQINACLPTAIAFKESLNKYGIWSEVVRYSWIDSTTHKARGHAMVAYLYPKGQNQLWTYDSMGSYRTRAFTNSAANVAQYAHRIRGNPEPIFGAEYIK